MAPDRFARFVAIDWSGAVGARQRGIAVAECTPGTAAPSLVRPGHIWSRHDVLEWVLAAPAASLIGFDLGPSLPFRDAGAFFPGWDDSPPDAKALWALVDRLCAEDPHLAATSFVDHVEASRHFRRHGGRTGDRFGTGRGRLRVTEHAQRAQGMSPYSNMNLVGAAQVGKSSLTGMRLLHRLDGRLPVWPFDADPGHGSLVVEIYTSIAARDAGRPKGRSKMRDIAALNAALAVLGSEAVPGTGEIDDHSSDALLTAAWLRANAHRAELWHPPALTPAIAATEGWTFGVT
ncbi:hypothetical protein M9980_02950 [Sphingomonas donggukensis]|uniref:DUF429 domain-containing protein n=1 Tax=Sphingomonas donggukensis TaxID=2949093 RepID=A0ABY4TXI3_9SPHN|nr:hypothetical protein [Sphingomonas donggukensis]URW77120.1 hypothetical protein M9980_02950 [Sphingomonas donggukensis]